MKSKNLIRNLIYKIGTSKLKITKSIGLNSLILGMMMLQNKKSLMKLRLQEQ